MNVTGLPLAAARAECERLSRSTVPQIFAERASEVPDGIALRYKDKGLYREVTWSAYWQRVRLAAAGLVARGLRPGARISLIAGPRCEYLVAHLGAVIIGAIPFGIYPTSAASEVALLLKKGEARIVFAGDQEYLDKLLDAERLSGQRFLEHIVLVDDRTKFVYEDKRLISFKEF